jgi:glycosyltransferase involved in cell wall biosynthesis
LIERLCCMFSDHVVISNDLWAYTLTRRSVRKAKCTTILNYPDPAIFRKSEFSRDARAPFTLVYPGTLNWHQGLDIAIQALAQVIKLEPTTELHIYGRGPEESNLKRLMESLLLKDHVKFKGNLSLEEVVLKMESADAGVVPKRASGFGNEAFSTKIFEFMALGVPVIVSKTKIDQFYFNDTLVAFFEPDNVSDLADKIINCIRDRALRARLIINTQTFIQDYSWDVKKDVYFKLVDELVACT